MVRATSASDTFDATKAVHLFAVCLSRQDEEHCGGAGRFSLTMRCQLLETVTVRRFEGKVKASKEAKTLPHLILPPNGN